jgi:hypothetical protein
MALGVLAQNVPHLNFLAQHFSLAAGQPANTKDPKAQAEAPRLLFSHPSGEEQHLWCFAGARSTLGQDQGDELGLSHCLYLFSSLVMDQVSFC